MFSTVLSWPTYAKVWNRSRSLSDCMGAPSTSTDPLSAANSPASTRARVVLPLPLSPTMERNALPGTERSMRSRIGPPVRDPEASRSPKLIRFATIAGGSARFREVEAYSARRAHRDGRSAPRSRARRIGARAP